jgi:hypothetical protein
MGQTVSLTATVAPTDAANQSLTWATSDAAVATVSATGVSALVTAVAAGSAAITVSSQDGHKTATCIVTVGMLAQWVQAPTSASSASSFAAMAVDSGGNIYAAGYIVGVGLYDFGGSVSAHGSSASTNVLLVKYNSTGTAQWARSVVGGAGASAFTGVATDASGNVFVVGTVAEAGFFDFDHGVVVQGAYAFNSNLVLVKYDTSGAAQWASTVVHATGATSYAAVATDSSGNLYAAGTISNSSSYVLGNDVSNISVSGFVAGGKNALLVKYNPAGAAQWAQSTSSGSGESGFAAVAVDGAGTPYGAGHLAGTVPLGFGNSVTATGTGSSNALLVHYNASGVAQWARAAGSGGNNSDYTAVAVSNAGAVFAAGSIYGNTANNFGGGVNVAGAYAAGSSILILKYDASGAAQWGHSAASAAGLSRFASLALDPAGRLYAAGLLTGPGSYDVGNSIVATTAAGGNEVLLTRYDSAGMCHGAQTATTGSGVSEFSAVATDGAAGIYAAGTVYGVDSVDFGNSKTVTGASSGGSNAVLVKYQ